MLQSKSALNRLEEAQSEDEAASMQFSEENQGDSFNSYARRPDRRQSFAAMKIGNELQRMVTNSFRRIETRRFGGTVTDSDLRKTDLVSETYRSSEEYKVTEGNEYERLKVANEEAKFIKDMVMKGPSQGMPAPDLKRIEEEEETKTLAHVRSPQNI